MSSGESNPSMPRSWYMRHTSGLRFSIVLTRAMTFLAPSFLAIIPVSRLICSSCSTAIMRSAFFTLARCNTAVDVESPVMVIRSLCDSIIFSSSSCGSTMVMLWLLRTKASAKCIPTSPSPAITMFISLQIKNANV